MRLWQRLTRSPANAGRGWGEGKTGRNLRPFLVLVAEESTAGLTQPVPPIPGFSVARLRWNTTSCGYPIWHNNLISAAPMNIDARRALCAWRLGSASLVAQSSFFNRIGPSAAAGHGPPRTLHICAVSTRPARSSLVQSLPNARAAAAVSRASRSSSILPS
jgi:hypothetical protein